MRVLIKGSKQVIAVGRGVKQEFELNRLKKTESTKKRENRKKKRWNALILTVDVEFESGFGGGSGGNVDDISNLWDQAVQDVSGGSGQGTTTGNSPYSSQGSSSREGISQSGNTQHSSSSGSELRTLSQKKTFLLSVSLERNL